MLTFNKRMLILVVLLISSQNAYAEQSSSSTVSKVSVMGVKLCSNVIKTGEYLEGQGYKNAAMFAKRLGRISNVGKSEGNENYNFSINNDAPKKRKAVNFISFHGSFKEGPNLFDIEKSQFERNTGITLSCKQYTLGPDTRTECKYPEGDPNRNRPGFSYTITHEENSHSFFVDAAAWGYSGC